MIEQAKSPISTYANVGIYATNPVGEDDSENQPTNYTDRSKETGSNPTQNQAFENVHSILDDLGGMATQAGEPSADFDSLVFSAKNAIFALGQAINELMADQPQILQSEMAISTELVSAQIAKWSQAFLAILQNDEQIINNAPDQTAVEKAQAKMSVDNAASTASSTGLNGVQSMVTQSVSSKTSSYQTLVQQVQSVVTALLNAMTQNWVI